MPRCQLCEFRLPKVAFAASQCKSTKTEKTCLRCAGGRYPDRHMIAVVNVDDVSFTQNTITPETFAGGSQSMSERCADLAVAIQGEQDPEASLQLVDELFDRFEWLILEVARHPETGKLHATSNRRLFILKVAQVQRVHAWVSPWHQEFQYKLGGQTINASALKTSPAVIEGIREQWLPRSVLLPNLCITPTTAVAKEASEESTPRTLYFVNDRGAIRSFSSNSTALYLDSSDESLCRYRLDEESDPYTPRSESSSESSSFSDSIEYCYNAQEHDENSGDSDGDSDGVSGGNSDGDSEGDSDDDSAGNPDSDSGGDSDIYNGNM